MYECTYVCICSFSHVYIYIYIYIYMYDHTLHVWVGNASPDVPYASNLASPLEIQIEASNGASDYGASKHGYICIYMYVCMGIYYWLCMYVCMYVCMNMVGNKYGEPVVAGFSRSFGQRLPNGQRQEWVKPIMFTAGIGQMNDLHAVKGEPVSVHTYIHTYIHTCLLTCEIAVYLYRRKA